MKTTIGILLLIGLITPEFVAAQGTTYISNLGETSGGSLPIGSDSWFAAPFRTGTNSGGYQINSVELLMGTASGSPSGFTVSVYSFNGGVPGSSLGTFTGADPASVGIFTYATSGSIVLASSTNFFIVVTAATPVAQGSYYWSTANTSSYSSSGGWFLGSGYSDSPNGSSWSFSRPNPFQFAVNATAVPEPSSLVLLCSGILFLASRLFRRAKSKAA